MQKTIKYIHPKPKKLYFFIQKLLRTGNRLQKVNNEKGIENKISKLKFKILIGYS